MAGEMRPLPVPTPETKHFWEGTRAGELRLQRCDDCRHTYFPSRPFQLPGGAAARVKGAKISVPHGGGGMFVAGGTIVFSNERP